MAAGPPSRATSWHAVSAGFLGWTLDAFDFFVLVFLVDTLASHFHVTKADIVFTLTATLAEAMMTRNAPASGQAGVIFRGVLLGEQRASKPFGQGSNPCAPAPADVAER